MKAFCELIIDHYQRLLESGLSPDDAKAEILTQSQRHEGLMSKDEVTLSVIAFCATLCMHTQFDTVAHGLARAVGEFQKHREAANQLQKTAAS